MATYVAYSILYKVNKQDSYMHLKKEVGITIKSKETST